MIKSLTLIFAFTSILLSGAIFGFFYAWVCSTMWGFGNSSPSLAIEAMQAVNDSVQNAVFAPAFFGTPIIFGSTALLAFASGNQSSALLFAAAMAVYLAGAFAVMVLVNVPMNEALAQVKLPLEPAHAAELWSGYSGRWQVFNQLRTLASGIALLLATAGVYQLAWRA